MANKCLVENDHRKNAFDYFVGDMEDSRILRKTPEFPVSQLVSFDWSVEDVVIVEKVMLDSG